MNEKLKEHFERNKNRYIVAAVGVTALTLVVVSVRQRNRINRHLQNLYDYCMALEGHPWLIEQKSDNEWRVRRFTLHPTDATHPQPDWFFEIGVN